MKSFVKILAILIQIFFYTGCFSKYETPVIKEVDLEKYETPVIKEVDLEKAGVVADFNMSITEEKVYGFYLYRIFDKEQAKKETEELKKKFPNLGIGNLPPTNTDKAMRKIIGFYGYDGVGPLGSKIVLKLTLTPLFNLKEDYVYYTQDRYHYKNHNKIKVYSPDADKKVMKRDKLFKYIMDLSEYHSGFKDGNYSHTGYDSKKYWAFGKEIIRINLPKGNYHIKLENLEDVPEIKQIKTSFSIYEKK